MSPAEIVAAIRDIDKSNTANHVRMNVGSDRVTALEARIADLEDTVAMLVTVVLQTA